MHALHVSHTGRELAPSRSLPVTIKVASRRAIEVAKQMNALNDHVRRALLRKNLQMN